MMRASNQLLLLSPYQLPCGKAIEKSFSDNSDRRRATGHLYGATRHVALIVGGKQDINGGQFGRLTGTLQRNILAEGFYFSVASVSQQDSHMGQPQEKELLWAIHMSQLQTGRGINITSYANLSARKEIVGKGHILLSKRR